MTPGRKPPQARRVSVPCPKCAGRTVSRYARPVQADRIALCRRRRCVVCDFRFTTLETIPEKIESVGDRVRARPLMIDRYMALSKADRTLVRHLVDELHAARKAGRNPLPVVPNYATGAFG